MDFEAAGLLDGLQREARAARQRLLERLEKDGATIEELKAAVAEDRLALLPVERVLGGRYTAADVEERTGIPAGLMVEARRLLGLPKPGVDDRVFSEEEVEAARSTRVFMEAGIEEEGIVEITRVVGEAMARVAATTTATFGRSFLKPGDTEADVAERFEGMASRLAPAFRPILIAAYQAHLRESVRRGFIGRSELERGHLDDAQQMTVCFADLVGFTRLGDEIETEHLGSVATRLAQLAADVAERPVRLIKTIGDAAMFVSDEPAPLVGAALSLLDAVQEADLPTLRAGLAAGPTLIRGGDFYGHSVNLASRVTGVARPGSVLCTEEVKQSAGEDFNWSYARRHRLKGIPELVPLYRARRPDVANDDATSDARPRRRREPRKRDRS